MAIAGDRLLGWCLKKQVSESQFRYSKLYRGDANADILIIGNSRGLNIYLPTVEELTSKKAFSICYNGMPGNLASALTRDYIDRYPNVKTVIVELCMAEMGDEKLLPAFASYMQYSPRIDSLIRSKFYTNWCTSRISHIFQFNNEVFQRSLYYMNHSDDNWTANHSMSKKLIQRKDWYAMEFRVDSMELQQIKSITDYCRNRSIEVKLVIAPFFPGLAIKNLELLKNKTEQITGFKVYDYSGVVQNSEGFSDFLHMNLTGCKEFMQVLDRDGFLNPFVNTLTISK